MTKLKQTTLAWIVVRQKSTGRRFPARVALLEAYQRDKDFTVQGKFTTREAARHFIRNTTK